MKSYFKKIPELIFGKGKDPIHPKSRKQIALIAFLAWIGIGADGLSSISYGPEQSFLALQGHTHLALYLAILMALTVFIISLSYNQVIELFPNGGGGYKASSRLLGNTAGVISGAALLIDYVLTIAISIASGIDQIFSLLPAVFQGYKLWFSAFIIVVLMILNLRGLKESIKVLLPVFIGFFVTHVIVILYGILAHVQQVPVLVPNMLQDTRNLFHTVGSLSALAFFFRAYALGASTYTGLEAVSNNVNLLVRPRVHTGRVTMLYMALSLSFMSAGIILLYLLWNAHHVSGQTLNAVVFTNILAGIPFAHYLLMLLLLLEMGLLFVAANTGFLGGPAVLANMAIDGWIPRQFKQLSSRLVTQNGIILFGIAALLILFITNGHVNRLVILYSINVFLTFSITLFGLCVYWIKHRATEANWFRKLLLAGVGTFITTGMFLITLVEKWDVGGIVAISITFLVVLFCYLIKRHYKNLQKQMQTLNNVAFKDELFDISKLNTLPMDEQARTAVMLVGKHDGLALQGLTWIEKTFPNVFKNFAFVSVGSVDTEEFHKHTVKEMIKVVKQRLDACLYFCYCRAIPAKAYFGYSTDEIGELDNIAKHIVKSFPNSVFFACRFVSEKENWWTRWLHNRTAEVFQNRLNRSGIQMMIIPVKIR